MSRTASDEKWYFPKTQDNVEEMPLTSPPELTSSPSILSPEGIRSGQSRPQASRKRKPSRAGQGNSRLVVHRDSGREAHSTTSPEPFSGPNDKSPPLSPPQYTPHSTRPSARLASSAPKVPRAGRERSPADGRRRVSETHRRGPPTSSRRNTEPTTTHQASAQSSLRPSTNGGRPAKASPVAASLPGNVRVVVFSTRQTQPITGKRYAGFPGIPPNFTEPNMILFVPRPQHQDLREQLLSTTYGSGPQTPVAPQSRPDNAAASPSSSPPRLRASSEQYETEAVQRAGGTLFTQVWVFLSVMITTLALPAALIILPYFATTARTPTNKEQQSTRPILSTATRTSSPHLTVPSMPVMRSTTRPGWTGCVDRVQVLDVQLSMNASSLPYSPNRPPFGRYFCVFNNSRVRKSSRLYFGPRDMPLTFCENIVYWSLALSDGQIESRTPTFDHFHGLNLLRDTVTQSSSRNAIILAAIGGYQQDSPEFSVLGRSTTAMSRFVTSALSVVTRYRLDGIAIHWVSPQQRCVDRDYAEILWSVVKTTRSFFALNSYRVTIAVFLPPNNIVANPLWTSLEADIDFFFLETQTLQPPRQFNLSMCADIADRMAQILSALPTTSQSQRKLCVGVSLAPWMTETDPRRGLQSLSASDASRYSGTQERAAVFELCRRDVCVVSDNPRQCIVLAQSVAYSSPGALPLYLFMPPYVLNPLRPRPYSNPRDVCFLFYDLDLDAFDRRCPPVPAWPGIGHIRQSFENPSRHGVLRSPFPACMAPTTT